jgi:hypothetical protein
MFRYAVWFRLKDANHDFFTLTKQYAAQNSNFLRFQPHITIRHTLEYEEGLDVTKRFKEKYQLPRITPVASVNVSKTPLVNANGKTVLFHAIEQPVLVNDERVRGLHISLAYKLYRPFTVAEFNSVKPYGGRFEVNDFEVALFSCHAKNSHHWRKIL